LLQLINDMLDLSTVEAGKMEFRPEPASLESVVGEVCDTLRTITAQKRVAVDASIEAVANVVADVAD
jgi:signal transduction histidine kinase